MSTANKIVPLPVACAGGEAPIKQIKKRMAQHAPDNLSAECHLIPHLVKIMAHLPIRYSKLSKQKERIIINITNR